MKINVAFLFGGKSVEHEISVISAQQAMHAMDTEKYHVIPIYITKNCMLYTGDALLEMEEYKDIKKLLSKLEQVSITKEEDGTYLNRVHTKPFQKSRMEKLDVAFPVVHGTNVEDGTLQGFLELSGLPYVGCDVTASALGMDKYAMKTVLADNEIPVLPCVFFYSKQYMKEPERVLDKVESKLEYPVIVKPVNLGSSVGIKIARSRQELAGAIELAAQYSPKILVERALTKLKEINCSVLGDYEEAASSVCEEPISGDEILSYQDKYMGGNKQKGMSGSDKRLPAQLSADTEAKIRSLAVKTFQALGCCGVSRIDFMIDLETDDVYVNEINTIPGSLSFYLWEATDIPFASLLDRMVSLALKRQRERENLTFSYDTNILSNLSMNSLKSSK